MAVRFTENLVPIEEDPTQFFADDPFADVTVAMVRSIINNDIAAGLVGYRNTNHLDLRLVLDFIEWWNALTTMRQQAMPEYPTKLTIVHRIADMKDLCHVCHAKLIEEPYSNPPTTTLICRVCNAADAADAAADGTTTRDEQVAAKVRRDLGRLVHFLYKHRSLCREDGQTRSNVFGRFKTWVQRTTPSSSTWIKAVNAQVYFHFRSNTLGMPSWMVDTVTKATMQMRAFHALMMPQKTSTCTALLRLDTLDDVISLEQKLAIRRTLYMGYLNNVRQPWPHLPCLLWKPQQQPDVLRHAMQSIETYEQRMQCTQLALVVRTLFRPYNPEHADNAMAIVVDGVYDFLGPLSTEYDEAELMKMWNMPLA
jgi:hypothetical protein